MKEATSDIALNAADHGMKRTASEISMVSSGSSKFPKVKHIPCPSYDTAQQKGCQAHVMMAMAPPGQHPG